MAISKRVQDAAEGRAAEDLLVQQIPALFRRALALSGSQSEAWDLVQDTLERALCKLPRELSRDQTAAWLVAVLKNLNIDRARSAAVRSGVYGGSEILDALPAPEPASLPAWKAFDVEDVGDLLRRLPRQQGDVLRMQCQDRLSLREIAAVLKVQPVTVGIRAFRARRRLREILSREARFCDGRSWPSADREPRAHPRI